MNLKQSLTLESLNRPTKKECMCDAPRVSALHIARQVFAMAKEQGTPFQNITPKDWAQKWLASKEFVLTEIQASSVAIPSAPKRLAKVFEQIHASTMKPVVVDLNKRGVGRTVSGYTPPVIVVDGKHRSLAQHIQGHTVLRAWVGIEALEKVIKPSAEVKAVNNKPVHSKIETASRLYAGMGGTPVPRQDVGDGGSQPTMRMPGVKSTGMAMEPVTKGQAPRVQAHTGSLGSGSGATPIRADAVTDNIQDASDPDVSDTNQTSTMKDHDNDCTCKECTESKSPGSGVGPRLGSAKGLGTGRHRGGASNSELTKILGRGKGCPGMESGKIPGVIKTKKGI